MRMLMLQLRVNIYIYRLHILTLKHKRYSTKLLGNVSHYRLNQIQLIENLLALGKVFQFDVESSFNNHSASYQTQLIQPQILQANDLLMRYPILLMTKNHN